jgi:hypothetical protein
MALKFFDDESTGTGNKPFASDYLKENPKQNGKQFQVREVYRTQSDKGYMFIFDDFSAFLFKNQKTAKQIIEALEFYCEKQDGYALVGVLDKTLKNGIKFAVDFDEPTSWFTRGNEHFSTTESDLGVEHNPKGNPFLPPVLSTPTLEANPTPKASIGNGRGERGLKDSMKTF